jgi:hypothetical protein
MERRFGAALGEPGHALLPPRDRLKDLRSPRVLLTALSVRTSAKGRQYLSGFLGKSRVAAFEGEADRYGNPTWDIFVGEPEPRDGTPAPRQSPPEREAANGRTDTPAAAGARPSGSCPPRRPVAARLSESGE